MEEAKLSGKFEFSRKSSTIERGIKQSDNWVVRPHGKVWAEFRNLHARP